MSGFTHRVTNQIHGPDIASAQARQFLEQGWVDDDGWLLRTIHEFAHVYLNFTAVAQSLVLAELSLDRQMYEAMAGHADLSLVRASRDSLSLAYDLLSPWSEAVALITEWDLDLTVGKPSVPLTWMSGLVGPDRCDGLLWRARLSPDGIVKKKTTLVSSSHGRGGHLLGHLLSRAFVVPGNLPSDEVLVRIMWCIFCNIDLAHAILDLAENPDSVAAAKEAAVETILAAVSQCYEEVVHGPSATYSARLEAGADDLSRRMQPLIDEFSKPLRPVRSPADLDLRDMGHPVAHFGVALWGLVGLGTVPVGLVSRGTTVSCMAEDEEIYSFDNKVRFEGSDRGTIDRVFCASCGPGCLGLRVSSATGKVLHSSTNDPHIAAAFRRALMPARLTEAAHSAANLLAAASTESPANGPDPLLGRKAAAETVGVVLEQATGASIDLRSLDPCGVSTALKNKTLVGELARLSNEYSSTRTPGGRKALPDGPAASDDKLGELDARLLAATGLRLVALTNSTGVLLW
jgi:hypothetical protein